MLIHPQFDPVALHIGSSFGIHWYGVMYLIGFLAFATIGKYRARKQPLLGWAARDIDDLLFYGIMGVILGGRLGYILFYKLSYYLENPLHVFFIWEGGMSFHGGFLGVLVAMALYARKTQRRWLQVTDFIAPLVPLGLLTGRLGNFINGELWGRVTAPDAPWAMLFPQARHADLEYVSQHAQWLEFYALHQGLPRHPSQLYQMLLEGVLLFVVLWLFSRKIRPMGAVSGLFLIGYGSVRFISEFARQPDDFLGLLALGLSMGQWLSLPMIIAGVVMLGWATRRTSAAGGTQTGNT